MPQLHGNQSIIVRKVICKRFEAVLREAVTDRWICDIDPINNEEIDEEIRAFITSAQETKAQFLKVIRDDQVVAIALPRYVPMSIIKQCREVRFISHLTGHPWLVYVIPRYRGKGIALEIINHCKTLFPELMWFPDSKNHKSIQLATRNGFKPIVIKGYNPMYHWSK